MYFAAGSQYSAHPRYSKPNDAGEQFMILAKVLVGHSTYGNASMHEPPARRLADGSDGPLYDSLADDISRPSIVVSCHRD
eukprot:COSAG04_NODE_8793_length_931_cov_1.018029_1_plen_79_part_10